MYLKEVQTATCLMFEESGLSNITCDATVSHK